MKVKIYTLFFILTFILPVGVVLGLSLLNEAEHITLNQNLAEEETQEPGTIELDGFNEGIQPIITFSSLTPEPLGEIIVGDFKNQWKSVIPGQSTPPPEN